jgi:hypothetical protein
VSDVEPEQRRRALAAFLAACAAHDGDPQVIARNQRAARDRAEFLRRLVAEFVATVRITSGAGPVQVEGLTRDGRYFYYRCRHGDASLGLGADQQGAWYDPNAVRDYGPSWFDAEGTYESFVRLARKIGLPYLSTGLGWPGSPPARR